MMAGKPARAKGFFSQVRSSSDEATDRHFEGVSPSLVAELVVVACNVGGAVLFGSSRDGGAASIRLYLEGEGETFYFRPGDDIEDFLRHWIEQYASLEDAPKTDQNGSKGRRAK